MKMIVDLFYESEDSNVASYADDTTLCSCAARRNIYCSI